MRMKRLLVACAAGLAGAMAAAVPTVARAESVAVPAGGTYTLAADVMLTGADTFVAGDAAGARCTIHGGGHAILSSADWTGTFSIRNCDVDGLGTAATNAVYVQGTAAASIVVDGATFASSSILRFRLADDVAFTFSNNTIEESSIVPTVKLLLNSPPGVLIEGPSTPMKLIQGNTVRRARIKLSTTRNWLIGGSTPAQGNVLVGTRVGLELEDCQSVTVRGNYSHTLVEGDEWNQVKNFSAIIASNLHVEHNVFSGRNWLVELNSQGGTGNEIAYNLIMNAYELGWVLTATDSGLRVHHNVLVATKDSPGTSAGGFAIEPRFADGAAASTEIYNNTFDAGGNCNKGLDSAVMLDGDVLLKSFRSNAILGVRLIEASGTALIHPKNPTPAGMPAPVQLEYTDYNLFYNPDGSVKTIYASAVAGKTARQDPGFGLNDVPASGAPNQQVDPKFAAPPVRLLPYDEATILARQTSVCQILAFYRQNYMPAADSPLVDKGDPQEGAGNDIGAIGAGVASPLDQFGKLCDPNDVGTPVIPAGATMCPSKPPDPTGGGGSGGGGSGGTGPHQNMGVACVCDAGGGASGGAGAGSGMIGVWVVVGGGLAVLARRRRGRFARRAPSPFRN